MRIGRIQSDPYYFNLANWQVVDLSTYADIPLDDEHFLGADDEENAIYILKLDRAAQRYRQMSIFYPSGIRIIRRVVRPPREKTAVNLMGSGARKQPPFPGNLP